MAFLTSQYCVGPRDVSVRLREATAKHVDAPSSAFRLRQGYGGPGGVGQIS